MAKITLINGDAADYAITADLMLTDPSYDLPGRELARIIDKYDVQHLILLTTMRQLIEFMSSSDWTLSFDFVFDGVMPKKSKSMQQPNYLHQTGVYLTRKGAKSRFNRKLRQRSDVFEANGYWPTIIRAPRDSVQDHGHAKNEVAITDLLGSFSALSVVDPFAGSGTTAIAAHALEMSCTAIERDAQTFASIKKTLRFLCMPYVDSTKSKETV